MKTPRTPREHPRTSVLINNYNNGPFLRHCLESVLSQIPAADEVIVYDDGSTDDSLHILQEFEGRLTLIARPHGRGSPLENQAVAIKTAFDASSGDLIFLLDGDDAFLPGKIAAYLEAYSANPDAVMIQAPLEKIDRENRFLGIEFEAARHQRDYLTHIYAENELNIYYPTSSLAFSREYLERRLPLDFGDRRHIWPDARLALLAPWYGRVVALPKPYSQWRRHPGSHTVAKHLSMYRLVRLNQEYFNEFCRTKGRRGISPWRSRYHRRRWFRHHFVPDFAMHWFRVLRWHTLSEGKRQVLLRSMHGPNPAELEREIARLRHEGLQADEQLTSFRAPAADR
jgi:glycosyltransferase involved in cell wall biosynthesis